ncbi:hypothetical protein LZZ90_08350 [Flavobacterium sp. SM15]|uniref:hypothetical protein n=1 Tax=Flavobacterium sp. SM15 TaxID=2908005 RepID=UPI001EDB0098|nr:hypothetical protein [Flavobacterium sp. SM15]MCG2611517.1 hypothetical protein [Flavobacterium sp. SM15]
MNNNEERLFINGKAIDLYAGFQLTKTLQVNDIASVENRQANFTRSIDIPKTPNNIEAFNYLGVVGNDSNLPYQQNTANYFVGNEAVIYNGWAVINETKDDYKINIYDGVIDFYKAIENKTFSEINLSGLTHSKNLSTVIDSWTGTSTPYKYIVSDYGGKVLYQHPSSGSTINIDYLTPAVKVPYLWDNIFSHYNFGYEGSIFESDDFQNLYITYPKGVLSTTPDELLWSSDDYQFQSNGSSFQEYPNTKKSSFLRFSSFDDNTLPSTLNNIHYFVPDSSKYRIEISGTLKPFRLYFWTSFFGEINTTVFPQEVDVWLCKNQHNATSAENVIPLIKVASSVGDRGDFTPVYFENNLIIDLEANESLCFIARTSNQLGYNNNDNLLLIHITSPLNLKISKVTTTEIEFDSVLEDFKIKDFINEIIWRFGLTIFKDKESNNYKFLTLAERLESPELVDWSDKFQGLESEKYILGNYAQNNVMQYKYNQENSNHKDGFINIQNVNLDDEKIIINSKIYAPEKDLTYLLPKPTNVYKLFNTEISDNDGVQEIKYKPLDKRFYFISYSNYELLTPKAIGSELLIESTSITDMPMESYAGLSFQDVIQSYYSTFSRILNKSKIITAKMWLTPADVSDFDFKKLYFISQLGSYFMVNKINNWKQDKLTNVELIKVDYKPVVTPPAETRTIHITGYLLESYDAFNHKITIAYTTTGIVDGSINVLTNNIVSQTVLNSSPIVIIQPINVAGGVSYITLQTVDGQVTSDNSVNYWG